MTDEFAPNKAELDSDVNNRYGKCFLFLFRSWQVWIRYIAWECLPYKTALLFAQSLKALFFCTRETRMTMEVFFCSTIVFLCFCESGQQASLVFITERCFTLRCYWHCTAVISHPRLSFLNSFWMFSNLLPPLPSLTFGQGSEIF